MVGKRSSSRGEGGAGPGGPDGGAPGPSARARPLAPALASRLAHALVAHMLAADTCAHADALMLAAKVRPSHSPPADHAHGSKRLSGDCSYMLHTCHPYLMYATRYTLVAYTYIRTYAFYTIKTYDTETNFFYSSRTICNRGPSAIFFFTSAIFTVYNAQRARNLE